jgi:hypothetical protein
MLRRRLLVGFLVLLTVACQKKVITAPVPGSIDSVDAYSFRFLADAQAALLSIKGWELCSDQAFPMIVTFDGQTFPCDKTAGPFPSIARPVLLKAEESYNIAQAAGHAYHAGASKDAAGLQNALTQLGTDISSMLGVAGKAKP